LREQVDHLGVFFWASLDFVALSAVPYGNGLDLGGTVVCLCLVNHPKSECFWVARAFSAYVGSLGSGENMAFPEGNPCVFTVGPGQEMKDKVIMTVEKVGSEEMQHLILSIMFSTEAPTNWGPIPHFQAHPHQEDGPLMLNARTKKMVSDQVIWYSMTHT